MLYRSFCDFVPYAFCGKRIWATRPKHSTFVFDCAPALVRHGDQEGRVEAKNEVAEERPRSATAATMQHRSGAATPGAKVSAAANCGSVSIFMTTPSTMAKASRSPLPSGVEVLGEITPAFSEILTPEALAFVACAETSTRRAMLSASSWCVCETLAIAGCSVDRRRNNSAFLLAGIFSADSTADLIFSMRSSVIYESRFYPLPAVSPIRQKDESAAVDRIVFLPLRHELGDAHPSMTK
jgi:hypothetical protein